MANNFTADIPAIWAKEQQQVFYKQNVALKICDVSFKSELSFWDTLHRSYRSTDEVSKYVRGTDIDIDDKTGTRESLVINQEYANGFYIDKMDAIQSAYKLAVNYWKDNGELLSNQVDSVVLWEYANAGATIDDGTLWGTATNGISLTTSNLLDLVSSVKKQFRKNNVPISDLKAVVSPEFEEVLIKYGAERETALWDSITSGGSFYRLFDFEFYCSNQLTGSAVLALGNTVTNGDTVTIAWQTFTFVTSIWTTPWNVLIGADADASRANLATLINNPTTTTSTGVAIGSGSTNKNTYRIFQNNITATDDSTANTLTVVQNGIGKIEVSSNLTNTSNTWTATKQKQHNLFMKHWAIALVVQKEPTISVTQPSRKLWQNYLNAVLFGTKTFNDGAKKLVNVELNSSTY